MFSRLLLIFTFPILLLRASQLEWEPPQEWVATNEVVVEAFSEREDRANFHFLLLDTQDNWETKSSYTRMVGRVTSQSGVAMASKLYISFDPIYQSIQMHTARIYRDGKWFDRLAQSRYHILHTEHELEFDMYNGVHTLVYFLDDVRVGDIVEYSYTVLGENPLFNTHFSRLIPLQKHIPIDWLTYRVIAPSDKPLHIKLFNTTKEPTVTGHGSTLTEWRWDVFNTRPFTEEEDEPAWYNTTSEVQLTHYDSWNQVAAHEVPFYALTHEATAEMCSLVERWTEVTIDPQEMALLALRFVQNDIRYLGLEEGVRGFQPSDPGTTLARRYGDCKEKTYLLKALLALMDIDSTPLLVNTREGKNLPDYLPTPFLFDHIVLRIEIGGTYFYVDPTFSHQAGSLETNAFPNYYYGLLVSEETQDLTPLPLLTLTKPIEINTVYLVNSDDTAQLNITTTYHGIEADDQRAHLAAHDKRVLSKNLLHYIQGVYGGGALLAPLQITDDLDNNALTMAESYLIPIDSLLDILSATLDDYLDTHVHPTRKAPYALAFPLWVQENIFIHTPYTSWASHFEEKSYSHPSLSFTHTLSQQGSITQIFLELEHLKDHVAPSDLRTYRSTTYSIYCHAPTTIDL